MRYSESDQPGFRVNVEETAEERLLKENENLKRQIEELKAASHPSSHAGLPAKLWRPSRLTIWAIVAAVAVLIIIGFVAGYLPHQKQALVIAGEASERDQALPRVEVTSVNRSSHTSELQLPGNIQAIEEAPILARADGYIERRRADIGDRVRAGQPLAEINAPELDEQVRQAKANLDQARAGLEEATANLEQGKSETELARTTAKRWGSLVTRGVVSQQENDQYQAQYQAKISSLQSLEKAVIFQRSGVAAADANLARLEKMQSYRIVKAPFDGVITLRNVDTGALVSVGNTLLFRIAQTGTLRTYVNVPQSHANAVHTGQTAFLTVSNLPGRRFNGVVARSANSLDPSSRTLLLEIHVPNSDGALLPGMYAQVDLSSTRTDAPLLIASDALMIRANGTQVALVGPDNRVHLRNIEVGRDYGDRLEVMRGLQEGDRVVLNPGDLTTDGMKVEPVLAAGQVTGPQSRNSSSK